MSNLSALMPQCLDIQDVLVSPAFQFVMHTYLALLFATILAILYLLREYGRNRISLHGNLLLLFTNIIILYVIHTGGWFFLFMRYRILLFIYQDPCDLLTPVWLVFCLYTPYYLYSLAYPSFHFCVMYERLRATMLADRYEREGQRVGIFMVLGIWFLAISYVCFVIYACWIDVDNFRHPQGVMFMTSKYNLQPVFYITIFILFLVIFTAFCDWRITLLNKRIRRNSRNSISYNLSRNYQLNENALTMQLILPLDVFYAIFYCLNMGAVLVIRSYRAVLTNRDYVFYYYLANGFLFLHTAVTIIVYIRFLHYVMKNNQTRSAQHIIKEKDLVQSSVHFKQLQALWQ